ncbi:hypothetical protein GCM10017783_07140 [Deinococcus piscis]|uniref:HAD family hydrolase n=1 Tax=Deinococcus piscis TaxID=394230 RepID=A0ABQ3K100_9DEIO|nr:hypothetical protein GCM10017783_07140 [Deinococcus piscis]
MFDLDGTLHDRTATLRHWLPGHLRRFGLPPEYAARFAELDDFGYRSKREVFPQLVQEFGLECDSQVLFDDFGGHVQQAAPMPHAANVLRELRKNGVALGLVTNGWPQPQRAVLAACGLADFFDAVVVSGEVGLAKPDPRSYHLALDALGIAPAAAWFVGDSPRNDIWGPQQVGMRAAWLPTGHPLSGQRPDATLSDLRGVLHLL